MCLYTLRMYQVQSQKWSLFIRSANKYFCRSAMHQAWNVLRGTYEIFIFGPFEGTDPLLTLLAPPKTTSLPTTRPSYSSLSHLPPPLTPDRHLCPFRELCSCFVIDQDVFRKILISCAILVNSSPSSAFPNK